MTEKRRTRTRDLNTVAASIVRQATGQEPVRRPVRPEETEQEHADRQKKPKA